MKKQYKAPLTEVVKVNAQQLICQSPALGGEYGGGSILDKNEEEFDENFW